VIISVAFRCTNFSTNGKSFGARNHDVDTTEE
jgi:hypothetical protein